jgi:hypothetical protein
MVEVKELLERVGKNYKNYDWNRAEDQLGNIFYSEIDGNKVEVRAYDNFFPYYVFIVKNHKGNNVAIVGNGDSEIKKLYENLEELVKNGKGNSRNSVHL